MNQMTDTGTMIAVLVAIFIGVALIIAVTRKKLDAGTLEGVANLMEALPVTEGNGVFDLIYKYSKVAVLAVEQLVKTGKIGKSPEERKATALAMVENAAEADKIVYGEAEKALADACIEAEVHELPRNKIPGITEAIDKADNAGWEACAKAMAGDNEAEQEAKPDEDPEEEAPGIVEAPPDEARADEAAAE